MDIFALHSRCVALPPKREGSETFRVRFEANVRESLRRSRNVEDVDGKLIITVTILTRGVKNPHHFIMDAKGCDELSSLDATGPLDRD